MTYHTRVLMALPMSSPNLLAFSPSFQGLECVPRVRSWAPLTRCIQRKLETRIYVGGKIFGMEDESSDKEDEVADPEKPSYGSSIDVEVDARDGDEEGSDVGDENEQTEKPRRKRRKKYDWDQGTYQAREEEQKRFAQEVMETCCIPGSAQFAIIQTLTGEFPVFQTEQVARKFPEIGQVVVDRSGKIIGGVNPFEGTDINLEDQANDDEEDFPELAGDIAGMDDPADAPWRLEAEKIIDGQVTECGLKCYDILWTFHKLEVTVTKAEGDGPEEDAGYVDSDKLMETIRAINAALEEREEELFVLGRHELIVATPGSKDILTTAKEFKAFRGFDIIVKTGGPFENKRELRGKLLERTFDELMISQSGRTVRIPLALVDEVRLPPALVETGEAYP